MISIRSSSVISLRRFKLFQVMPAIAFFFGVGIKDFRVANIIGVLSVKKGFTLSALQLYFSIYRGSFKNMAVIKYRGPRSVGKLLVDLPVGEPVVSRLYR